MQVMPPGERSEIESEQNAYITTAQQHWNQKQQLNRLRTTLKVAHHHANEGETTKRRNQNRKIETKN